MTSAHLGSATNWTYKHAHQLQHPPYQAITHTLIPIKYLNPHTSGGCENGDVSFGYYGAYQ